MNNSPKYTAKADGIFFDGQLSYLISTQLRVEIHFLKTKLYAERETSKQQLKVVTGKAKESMPREETQHLVMSMSSSLQAVSDCRGFSSKY